MENNKFGKQLEKLINHLGITNNLFAKRCGLLRTQVVPEYISGKHFPSLETLNKIIARYPVNIEWLYNGKGEMWQNGKEYFEQRFKKYKKKTNTAQQKIEALLDVYELTIGELSRKTGINTTRISRIKNGHIDEIEPDYILLFRNSIPFIPYEWYLNK